MRLILEIISYIPLAIYIYKQIEIEVKIYEHKNK